MDSLPPELISRVVHYIDTKAWYEPKLQIVPCTTVSRSWKAEIERRTFSTIYIYSAKRFQVFEQLASNAYRKSCIRHIDLMVELESYDKKSRANLETDDEHQRNNKIFTTIFHSLFGCLASRPDGANITLTMNVQSPSDYLLCREKSEYANETEQPLYDGRTL
ncbi:hypothetical protein N7467_002365 [Penicillium canescens]|nr:hypothetical protein N7467_002365 [Penicillium canescens]